MVMSTLCGENLLENRVMVYFPGASPTVLKSNSFSPSLLSQWNLFASSLSVSSRKEIKFPRESVMESEKRDVLTRRGVPVQLPPLNMNNWNVTSITFTCAALNVRFPAGDTRQNLSPTWLRGTLRATTLDRPGVDPSMVGSVTVGDEE